MSSPLGWWVIACLGLVLLCRLLICLIDYGKNCCSVVLDWACCSWCFAVLLIVLLLDICSGVSGGLVC